MRGFLNALALTAAILPPAVLSSSCNREVSRACTGSLASQVETSRRHILELGKPTEITPPDREAFTLSLACLLGDARRSCFEEDWWRTPTSMPEWKRPTQFQAYKKSEIQIEGVSPDGLDGTALVTARSNAPGKLEFGNSNIPIPGFAVIDNDDRMNPGALVMHGGAQGTCIIEGVITERPKFPDCSDVVRQRVHKLCVTLEEQAAEGGN